jgi:hypothetical protein
VHKQTIKYDDLDGNPVEGEFYFHITKLEAIEMDLNTEGGLEAHLERIKQTEDARTAFALFKDVIIMAHGEKSADNKTFIKTPEITSRFRDSDALGELIMSFIENPEKGAEFIEKCLPARLVREAKEARDSNGENSPGGTLELKPSEPVLEKSSHISFKDRKDEALSLTAEQIKNLSDEAFDDWNSVVDLTKLQKDQMVAAMQRRNR